MRFSIKPQGEDKMIFHVFPPAEKATGLYRQTIKTVLDNGTFWYQRKSDGKVFVIRKEEPIKIATIAGEDFFSLEEIQEKFGVTPTRFLNQVLNGKFMKKIDWISPELFPEKEKNLLVEMQEKIDQLSSRVEKLEKRWWKRIDFPILQIGISTKIWKDFFSSRKFYFEKKIIFKKKSSGEKNLLQILEKAKNSIISFCDPLNLDENLFQLEKISFSSIAFSKFGIVFFENYHFFSPK